MATYSEILALRESNAFRFVCPVFNQEVEAADCFDLLHHHMRGEQVPERNGCHACIRASKCPTREMLDEASEDPKRYYSETSKLGRISEKVLERGVSILVPNSVLDHFRVEDEERKIIAALNEGTKPTARSKIKTRARVKKPDPAPPSVSSPRPAAEEEGVVSAAQSGDLGAAITAAVAAETAVAATPKPEIAELQQQAEKKVEELKAEGWQQKDFAEALKQEVSEPHTIPPDGTPHDNPRMADVEPYVGPPVASAPAKPKSLIEIAREMQAKRNAGQ